ncbi:hypothetical protein [Amycolatopsis sp. A1MSW2902]
MSRRLGVLAASGRMAVTQQLARISAAHLAARRQSAETLGELLGHGGN